MADIKQDLLSLNYSASFGLQGMQEADINLNLTPAAPPCRHSVRHCDGWDQSAAQRHGQTL